jgi:phosphatidylserine/phosphatidylglycerophosphate/cardiolipin synthase-like enzyme
MSKEPRYWGSWKGRVVKAIAIDGARTWNEIRDQTGLSPKTLNKVLSELFNAEAIEKKDENEYRVSYELYKEYKEFFDTQVTTHPKTVKVTEAEQKDLVSWIDQWKDSMDLEFSPKPEHFFLEGADLNTFSMKLIQKAKREVLVVNPFVDQCDLSDTLWKSVGEGKRVVLITRPPEDRFEDLKERKENYLKQLEKNGVEVVRNPRVHAKLIAVDRAVAIISSMNFQSSSTGGSSWEAGLVTKNDMVVEDIVGTIYSLFERPDSK